MGDPADDDLAWALDGPDFGQDDSDDDFACPTCRGTGTVSAITNPDWAPFVASYGPCPSCDGDGTI